MGVLGRMGSGEDAQFVFAKYDYTAQGNQVTTTEQKRGNPPRIPGQHLVNMLDQILTKKEQIDENIEKCCIFSNRNL